MHLRVLALAVIAACAGASAATASEAAKAGEGPSLMLELNAVKPAGSACRIAFVVKNELGTAIKDLGFELVLFDKSQRVQTVLSVAAGSMPVAKTRVKQFDLKGIDCDSIGRVLLNDVSRCDGEGLSAAGCLKAARPSSKTPIPFDF